MRVASAADVASWLASQTCRCGARAFAADPVLAERGGTLVVRIAGCTRCGEPAYVDAELPEPIERAVAGKHVLDPSAIALLAPFVANGFPDYAGPPPETIDMSAITMPPGWRVVDLDLQIADTAARLRASLKLKLADAVQAASAVAINAQALVTHDRDFSRLTSLRVIA